MDNLLLKYMNERVTGMEKKNIEPGPVITLSRECGCSGRQIAERLTHRINERTGTSSQPWRWINKEILCLASEELKIHPDRVKELLKADGKNFFDDIVSSFTVKYYIHDSRMKRVIRDVVRHLAFRGNVVIVGRGSEALTTDIQHSLHIKLYAPLNWKADIISRRENISHDEAVDHVLKADKRRTDFVNTYLSKNQEKIIYDVGFNCARFSQDEIVDAIMKLAEMKSFFK